MPHMGNFLYTKMTGLRVGDAIGRFVTGRRHGPGEMVGIGTAGRNLTGGAVGDGTMITSRILFCSSADVIMRGIATAKAMHPPKLTQQTKQRAIVRKRHK